MPEYLISRDKENQLIINKIIDNIEIPLYKFPALPLQRCEICNYPTTLLFCRYHRPFEFYNFPRIIESVNIIGYYSTDFKGKAQNQLTKLIQLIKKDVVKDEIVKLFSDIIIFILNEKKLKLDLLTYIPSRIEHKFLKRIAELLSSNLNLKIIPSEELIDFQSIALTRDTKDYFERKNLIEKKFLKNEKVKQNNNFEGNILILDDLINTGWTISRIASIIKDCLPKINNVYGFCLGRIIPKSQIMKYNLKF